MHAQTVAYVEDNRYRVQRDPDPDDQDPAGTRRLDQRFLDASLAQLAACEALLNRIGG